MKMEPDVLANVLFQVHVGPRVMFFAAVADTQALYAHDNSSRNCGQRFLFKAVGIIAMPPRAHLGFRETFT